jgi:mTERF domain-containing protein
MLAPRVLALRDRVSLSTPQITRFLLVASRALRECDVTPRLEFFISFYGLFDRVLVAAKKSWGLLSASLEKVIKPNIALFRQRGVPDVAKVCLKDPWVLTFNPERVKEVLLRAEELRVPPTSRMFRQALAIVSSFPVRRLLPSLSSLRGLLVFLSLMFPLQCPRCHKY